MLKFVSGFFALLLLTGAAAAQGARLPHLKVSANGRYLVTDANEPFFWLGDTGWLLFGKLTRDEAERYLEDRRRKGFNVVQAMMLHHVKVVNAYGDTALRNSNVATPLTTPGSAFANPDQYDYWDHLDFVVDLAASKGIYMAMVPVWGSNVKSGFVKNEEARTYANFLAIRYRSRSNIIWLNGGDIPGSDSLRIWQTIGNTLNTLDPNHLITFHPRGRTTSSKWFHNEGWLDFNMFQSGHRRYDQDTSANEELHYGEDNWRYVVKDFSYKPVKPSIDGEPSYEKIPQGLHDTTQPLWGDRDVRRYGYWSVFAGGFGYTYGHNAVMQMRKGGESGGAYGSTEIWSDAINDPGAGQMIHLKNLMLSRPFLERVPDQSLVAGDPGSKYDFLIATRGKKYAFIYTYTGRDIPVQLGRIEGSRVKASWYNPRTGATEAAGTYANRGARTFDPPGEKKDGNDWVLVLDGMS